LLPAVAVGEALVEAGLLVIAPEADALLVVKLTG